MSKIQQETMKETVAKLFSYAKEKKKKFTETIDLQVGLKGYDPQRDKRFNGTVILPSPPKKVFRVCVLGDEYDCDRAKEIEVDFLSVEDLKKFNKDKKLVKKLAKKYNAFIASETVIKQIPRLLGPGLNKAGKFPTQITHSDNLTEKIIEVKSMIRFQLKKIVCMAVPVANVEMTEDQAIVNISSSINFLVSLLKKNWQNIKSLYIKTTMGPPCRIY